MKKLIHNKYINKKHFRLFDLKKTLKIKLNNQYYNKTNVNNLFSFNPNNKKSNLLIFHFQIVIFQIKKMINKNKKSLI